jgi:calcineurin-like phosphoesterase family protein
MPRAIHLVADTHFHGHHLRSHVYRAWWNDYIALWNSRVQREDIVVHLGDVCFGTPWGMEILHHLHGTKHLILGNHDIYPHTEYQKYFVEIHDYFIHENILLSHAPMVPQYTPTHIVGTTRYDVTTFPARHPHVYANLHGHYHTYGPTKFHRYGRNRTAEIRTSVPYALFTIYHHPVTLSRVLRRINKHCIV